MADDFMEKLSAAGVNIVSSAPSLRPLPWYAESRKRYTSDGEAAAFERGAGVVDWPYKVKRFRDAARAGAHFRASIDPEWASVSKWLTEWLD